MEDTESLSSSINDLLMTPTHTSIPDSGSSSDIASEAPHLALKTNPPYDGATFIICELLGNSIITLKDGKLCMFPRMDWNNDLLVSCRYDRGSHWRCVEDKGRWLGFKNAVSGQFIGHDNKRSNNWGFRAKKEAHRHWEFFCARRHWSGGYEMLVKDWDSFRAMKVGGPDNTELLVAEEGERGTLWEFLEIETKY